MGAVPPFCTQPQLLSSEMFGAEGFLMDRCINKEVFVKAEHMINGFKDYFISHNEVVYDNPSPGNKDPAGLLLGTPFSAPAPTLKISTNTPLAEKKGGWIDFNTGVIADGEKTIDEAAKDLLDLVIRVASGEQTKAEKHGFREISIFKDGVVL